MKAGHRLFDEEDIQRIEEIKRWISNGVPVGKVKALLETTSQDTEDDWSRLQEEMMSILRMANPAQNYARELFHWVESYPVDQLINHVYLPVRQRLVLDHNTSRIMSSMFDGALIEIRSNLAFRNAP
ncbi:MerR family transcriptional regulator [Escherichia coli]|uniref:MerR family transcriptional regulator n=1 Tax=Escherichia coli TaxID=562 RepID=UPI000DF943D7|nr:MerR family transcriptional regulator [Escherichia coli]